MTHYANAMGNVGGVPWYVGTRCRYPDGHKGPHRRFRKKELSFAPILKKTFGRVLVIG